MNFLCTDFDKKLKKLEAKIEQEYLAISKAKEQIQTNMEPFLIQLAKRTDEEYTNRVMSIEAKAKLSMEEF